MIGVSTEMHIDLRGVHLQRAIEGKAEELAYRIVEEARRIIDESTPSGRIYRRGRLTAPRTKEGLAMGLKPRGSSRMVTGATFHRASAAGQPLAEDTGESYRDMSVRRMAGGVYRVRFGGWTGYWEFVVPEDMRRPTVMPAIEAAVAKTFNQ